MRSGPELNFNPAFFISLFKSLLGKIFTILFRTSNDQTASKKIWTEFPLKFSDLKSNFTLTLGYLNPALNNRGLERYWWEPACIKFCNHMFKNSRKRYRNRGKDTRIQPALKQIRLWHLIPYTLRKKKKNKKNKKKTHLLKCSFVHTGLAPKYHPGPISDQVYHQISFLRFCYGFSWSCEPWYQKFPNPEI